MPTQVQTLTNSLANRAQAILDDPNNYSQKAIMSSAFGDFTALGSMSGVMAVMSTGKLTGQQIELAKRIAAKVIAVVSQYEEKPGNPGTPPE